MRYTAFTLENYRGVSGPLTIELKQGSENLRCLVGNNESGKTTILTGIELIGKLCKGYELDSDELVKIRPRKATSFSGKIALSAKILFENQELSSLTKGIRGKLIDNSILIKFSYDVNMSEFVGNEIEIENFSGQQKTKIISSIKKNAPAIIYADEFSFDVPKIIRFKSNATEDISDNLFSSSNNKFWQEIFADILRGAENSRSENDDGENYFSKYVSTWISKGGDKHAIDQRIAGMNKFLKEVVKRDWEDISGLTSSFDRFEIRKVDNENQQLSDYEIIVLEGGNVFYLNDRSKGCRWFFCFKLLTEIRSQRNDGAILFLLDEPASNLHIHPQERILACLKKLSRDKQVIYSTHAPHLIDIKPEKSCLIVHNRKMREIDQSDIIISEFDEALKNETLSQQLQPIIERSIIHSVVEKIGVKKILAFIKEAESYISFFERVSGAFKNF